MEKRLLSILLTFVLLLGLAPTMVLTSHAGEGDLNYDIIYPLENGELHFDSASGTIVYGSGSGSLTIPSEIEGTPVVAIGAEAFYLGNAKFSEIIIPDSVHTIGRSAFAFSPALKRVVLPSGLAELSPFVFSHCTSLNEVMLPNTLLKIGTHAFYKCGALANLTLPESLQSVEEAAFRECDRFTELVFPESVTEIGASTFFMCERLERVQLPASLTEIPAGLFDQCPALTQVNIPSGVTKIGRYAFSECSSLEQPSLPDGLTVIEEKAFYRCLKFTSVAFPESLTRIEAAAFSGCNKLDNVDLPDSLEYLGCGAFNSCLSVYTSSDISYLDGWVVQTQRTDTGKVIIDEGTVGIAEKAIGYALLPETPDRYVSWVEIPASVRYLDVTAFYNASRLYEVIVAEDNPYFTAENDILYNKDKTKLIFCSARVNLEETPLQEGLKEIGPYAFQYNYGTKRVVFPDSLVSIGKEAFFSSEICRVEFGNGLKTIGEKAFYECTLTAVTLNDQLESVGEMAFSSCNLVRIDLGKSLRTIGLQAFSNNFNLQSIEFPATVETVGEASFYGCGKLKTVIFHGNVPEFGQAAFWYSPHYAVYYYYDMPWYEPIPELTLYYIEEGNWETVTEYRVAPWQEPEVQSFADVADDQWFADYVDYAVREGLMNGIGNDQFDPEGSMTRAMLVTVLWRFAGAEEGNAYLASITYRDVPKNAWYADAVGWASARGIVNGVSDDKFDPEGKITREQLATILQRYSRQLALDPSLTADLSGFKDSEKVMSYAKKSMEWVVAAGLITGETKADGIFLSPQGNATRAQVAAILMRFIENNIK